MKGHVEVVVAGDGPTVPAAGAGLHFGSFLSDIETAAVSAAGPNLAGLGYLFPTSYGSSYHVPVFLQGAHTCTCM